MATTYKRICIKDLEIVDGDRSMTIKRGKEYITTDEVDGKVRVLSQYWVWVDVSIFAGEELFTNTK